MKLRKRFHTAVGLALSFSVVAAAHVAAHPPLIAALDLPGRIDSPDRVAAPVPNGNAYWRWDDSLRPIPSAPPLDVSRPGRLLPNWEVGRNAVVLIPNYEAGMATVQLLRLGVLPGVSP
jgi:hypothetical protein